MMMMTIMAATTVATSSSSTTALHISPRKKLKVVKRFRPRKKPLSSKKRMIVMANNKQRTLNKKASAVDGINASTGAATSAANATTTSESNNKIPPPQCNSTSISTAASNSNSTSTISNSRLQVHNEDKDSRLNPTSRQIAPTLQGITESIRVLKEGKTLYLPTETVYFQCRVLHLTGPTFPPCSPPSTRSCCLEGGEMPQTLTQKTQTLPFLLTHDARSIRKHLSLKSRAYAIDPQSPVVMNESFTVLTQLAHHFWPGKIPIYMKVSADESISSSSSSSAKEGKENNVLCARTALLPITPDGYVGIMSPSHPLPRKLLRMMRVLPVVGVPTEARQSTDVTAVIKTTSSPTIVHAYPTAKDSNAEIMNNTIVVLNGEDKRETLSVPTCSSVLCTVSLWIDETKRKVYIKGITGNEYKQELERALFSIPSTSMKNRTILAVLSKWKVLVDGAH